MNCRFWRGSFWRWNQARHVRSQNWRVRWWRKVRVGSVKCRIRWGALYVPRLGQIYRGGQIERSKVYMLGFRLCRRVRSRWWCGVVWVKLGECGEKADSVAGWLTVNRGCRSNWPPSKGRETWDLCVCECVGKVKGYFSYVTKCISQILSNAFLYKL